MWQPQQKSLQKYKTTNSPSTIVERLSHSAHSLDFRWRLVLLALAVLLLLFLFQNLHFIVFVAQNSVLDIKMDDQNHSFDEEKLRSTS